MELVDTLVLEASAERRESSNLSGGTIFNHKQSEITMLKIHYLTPEESNDFEPNLLAEYDENHLAICHPSQLRERARRLHLFSTGNDSTLFTVSDTIIREFQILRAEGNTDFEIYLGYDNPILMSMDERGFFTHAWPSGYFDVGYKQTKAMLFANVA